MTLVQNFALALVLAVGAVAVGTLGSPEKVANACPANHPDC